MLLRTACAALLLVAAPTISAAQRPGARVRVRGVVYDSLRHAPLALARITLDVRSTVADARGRFEFDSVVPGTYTIAAQHAALDSAGFSGLSSRAVVDEDGGDLRIATPSFETLWRFVCRRRPPKDSSLVYGTIREAGQLDPVRDAAVRVTWIDLEQTSKRSARQKLWAAETRSDDAGTYVVCGIPNGFAVRVQAAGVDRASGAIDVRPSRARVYRRDLTIGPPPADSARHAVITGVVTGPNGESISDAMVVVNDVTDGRSSEDGTFALRHVPAGTRQLEVFALGMRPELRVLDVAPGDTQRVSVRMTRVTTLGAVRVTARRGKVLANEFDERRRAGMGYAMDSTIIETAPQFLNALAVVPSLGMYFEGSSVRLTVPSSKGGECAPELRIDGVLTSYNHLQDLVPRDIAGVEVYIRALSVPARYVTDRGKPPCGVVLVWTKYAFRAR